MAPSSIQVYLASIGSLHRQHGYRDPTRHNPKLKIVLQGVKRAHALKATDRQPISALILARLLRQVKDSKSLHRHDKDMLAAAFSLAFFGFLRVSEFTLPSTKAFNPRVHPTTDCIKWGKGHYSYFIKRSKTDQLSRGSQILICSSHSRYCPVKAMKKYLSGRVNVHPHRTPLFMFHNNQPLTRHSCLRYMRGLLQQAGYNPKLFNTHSFRIGAATHAAQLGLPTVHIKLLGRWRSSTYQRYTRSSTTTLKHAASHLASSFAKY